MPDYYVIDPADPRTPIPCDVLTWARWFEDRSARILAHDRDERPGAEDVLVSTVFMGLDHDWRGIGPPVLWETCVLGGPDDGRIERYTSYEDALAGHQRMCQWVARRYRS